MKSTSGSCRKNSFLSFAGRAETIYAYKKKYYFRSISGCQHRSQSLLYLSFPLHRINPINPGTLEGWIFQQDAAPPHCTKKIRDLLNEEFGSNYFAGGKRGAKLGLGWDYPSLSCDPHSHGFLCQHIFEGTYLVRPLAQEYQEAECQDHWWDQLYSRNFSDQCLRCGGWAQGGEVFGGWWICVLQWLDLKRSYLYDI